MNKERVFTALALIVTVIILGSYFVTALKHYAKSSSDEIAMFRLENQKYIATLLKGIDSLQNEQKVIKDRVDVLRRANDSLRFSIVALQAQRARIERLLE